MNTQPPIPVTLLTGFLGSGKTTLLNQLLGKPDLKDTAVIINEFGEIPLDHLLIEQADENLRVLNNGCLCCAVRGDLIDTLQTLQVRRASGQVPAFSRVIIETTGLADPAPILHTLMVEPDITRHYRLGSVVTTVDAINGANSLQRHAEASKQVAVADCLLLTKTDLVSADTVATLRRDLLALNPMAQVLEAANAISSPGILLDRGWYEAQHKTAHVRSWLAFEALQIEQGHSHHHHDVNRHSSQIQAHCFTWSEAVAEAQFHHWLELMAAMRGEKMLRIKGLIQLLEQPEQPMLIHGVQHVLHPPLRLVHWPSKDQRSRLVFITRDLPRSDIARTLQKFVGIGSAEAIS